MDDPITFMSRMPRFPYYDISPDVVKPQLRQWKWPEMRPYLGFSHVERVRLWQFQWWMITVGAQQTNKVCNICGKFDYKTVFHSENYYDYATCVPLCHSCHMALHRRGLGRKWDDIVQKYTRTGDEWFANLLPMSFDMAGYMRDTFGEHVTDLFSGVLFKVPPSVPHVILEGEDVRLLHGKRVRARRQQLE
jgi:hypothetical protein